MLVTVGGRLVRTAGLPANIGATKLLDADPLTKPMGRTGGEPRRSLRRLVDLAPGDHYGVMITSTSKILGPEVIEISELKFDTVAILERCHARGLNWTFDNKFWVEAETGLVWKSIQHIHPEVPPAELELLKPYVG